MRMKKAQVRRTKREFLRVFEDEDCKVNRACKTLGISRSSVYRWLKMDSKFAFKVEVAKEIREDRIQSDLYERSKRGDVRATIKFLTTYARDRGWHK